MFAFARVCQIGMTSGSLVRHQVLYEQPLVARGTKSPGPVDWGAAWPKAGADRLRGFGELDHESSNLPVFPEGTVGGLE
jgi:hypothetical protein